MFLYKGLLLLDTFSLKLNHGLQVNLTPFQIVHETGYKTFAIETTFEFYKWLEILLGFFQYNFPNKLDIHLTE
jgi:hypothetical protein